MASNLIRRSIRITLSNSVKNLVSTISIRTASTVKQKNIAIRNDLAISYRGLWKNGFSEGICNHLTAIAPARSGKGNVMLVIPYGLNWCEVTCSKLLGLNANQVVVEGEGEPELTAATIHAGVYRNRPDVKCVMHTHMPYTTALACLEDPRLLMIHQNSARFFNKIAYDSGYQGLIVAEEESDRVAKVLGDKTVLFLGNHGVLVAASTIYEAYDTMYYIERAAMFQVFAQSTGKKLSTIPDNVCERISKYFYQDHTYMIEHFNAVKRLIDGDFPDYRG